MRKPYISKVLRSLSREYKIKINFEPEFGRAGQIQLSDGRLRYFRTNFLDINPFGASEIAKDKDYAQYFLKKLRFPIVESYKFYLYGDPNAVETAYLKAAKIGFPVIVKPNDSTQGYGVSKIYTKRDFKKAANAILRKNKILLVQKIAPGADFRVVVFKDEVIAAYQRIPLSIVGDGKNTIIKLIEKKQKELLKNGREIKIDLADFRIINKLKRDKLTLNSVPEKNKKIFLLDNANLSSGGDAKDVTDVISEEFKKIAISVAQKMNLKFCGVDLITEDEITSNNPKKYIILEISPGPGLDHFAQIGKKQKNIVRELYRKILDELIRK